MCYFQILAVDLTLFFFDCEQANLFNMLRFQLLNSVYLFSLYRRNIINTLQPLISNSFYIKLIIQTLDLLFTFCYQRIFLQSQLIHLFPQIALQHQVLVQLCIQLVLVFQSQVQNALIVDRKELSYLLWVLL